VSPHLDGLKGYERRQIEEERRAVELQSLMEQIEAHAGGIASVLKAPPQGDVLFQGTVMIDTNGVWTKRWPVSFLAVSVANTSATALTVLAGEPAGPGFAPARGAGQFAVPSAVMRTVALKGHAITVYGTAGALFDVTIYSRPREPNSGPCGSVPSVGAAPLYAATHPAAKDDPAGHPVGALTTLATGQNWIPIGSNHPAYVKSGAFYPAITYGTAPVAGDEFFATTIIGAPVLSGGGRFRIRASAPSTINGVGLTGAYGGDVNNGPVHLTLSQYSWNLAYVLGGVQHAVTPDEHFGAPPYAWLRSVPLLADSLTVYAIHWALDLGASRLYLALPDGTVCSFTDPNFAILAANANQPFWEGQTPAATDAIFEWVDVWADTSPQFATFGIFGP
jgi:hypothetical protein